MSKIRPIDAEMILCDIDDYFDRLIKKEVFSKGAIAGIKETMQEIVENTPTLDYAPMVHAKWERTFHILCGGGDVQGYKCSNCGREISFFGTDDELEEYPYCHCGAKMDLRNDET